MGPARGLAAGAARRPHVWYAAQSPHGSMPAPRHTTKRSRRRSKGGAHSTHLSYQVSVFRVDQDHSSQPLQEGEGFVQLGRQRWGRG